MKTLGLEEPKTKEMATFDIPLRRLARLILLVFIGLAFLSVAASSATAYMGGPIRAYIGGFEPETKRVYYFLMDYSEAAVGPRVSYFDLDAPSPAVPIRAPDLDGLEGNRKLDVALSDVWRSLAAGLQPLDPLRSFDLRVSLSVDSAGQDPDWLTPRYEGSLLLELGDMGRRVDITLYCEPMVRIRGPYGIPGRPGAIVVVTYRGRAEGCEEIERPVLLIPGLEYDRGVAAARHEARPASWDQRSHGKFGGQFEGRFGEVGNPEDPVVWYLFQDYFSLDPPKIWLVDFKLHPPMQPIRFGMPEADSVMGAWGAYRKLVSLGGRRTFLRGVDVFDVTLRLESDSVGVDPQCGAPRYEGRLVAETPDGVGAIDLTMFCSTLLQVRGVFGLPERPELALFVTYNGHAREPRKEDTPLIIYPRKAER
jgi:hypothetical protein